jgi:hypothetical protein
MSKVLKWMLKNRTRLRDFYASKSNSLSPPDVWWLLAVVLQTRFFDPVMTAFKVLQTDSSVASKQYETLARLLKVFVDATGAMRDESKDEDCKVLSTFANEESEGVCMGQFSVTATAMTSLVRSAGVAALEMFDALESAEQMVAVGNIALVYLTAMNGFVRILRGRASLTRVASSLPSVFPISVADIAPIEFVYLLREHKRRLLVHFSEEFADLVLNEYRDLRSLLEAEKPMVSTLVASSKFGDFKTAWRPLGTRFASLQTFLAGIATPMPTTSRVEGDFSLANYRRNAYCSRLSDFSLEGVMHAKQLKTLQDSVMLLESS